MLECEHSKVSFDVTCDTDLEDFWIVVKPEKNNKRQYNVRPFVDGQRIEGYNANVNVSAEHRIRRKLERVGGVITERSLSFSEIVSLTAFSTAVQNSTPPDVGGGSVKASASFTRKPRNH